MSCKDRPATMRKMELCITFVSCEVREGLSKFSRACRRMTPSS